MTLDFIKMSADQLREIHQKPIIVAGQQLLMVMPHMWGLMVSDWL